MTILDRIRMALAWPFVAVWLGSYYVARQIGGKAVKEWMAGLEADD